ncbi:hypothetical protein [Bacteriovorax sp. Seq25_V]|uniref:hypothetical protein n=1 Tax=Bacteriovorax sp. Seq25_V TaxID=1201288 RepID=UPI000389E088|nr:hypothetical protein [Bacteriovorax sp. Seq25_V]EQC47731.1 hypothetical protein M900_A0184 [Bacteriovorax sp. Seq25_V]
MRGTFFHEGKEIVIETQGESWHQSDSISGVVNANGVSAGNIVLALIDVKKFNGKKDDAYEIVESLTLSGAETKFDFKLDDTAFISEKSKSLCLFAGNETEVFGKGILLLSIKPHRYILDFIQVFETFFRFKLKTIKSKKKDLELVFTPPANKDWEHIKKFTITSKIEDGIFYTNFTVLLSKLSFEGMETKAIEEKVVIKKEFGPRDYLIYGDSFDQEKIQAFLTETLEKFKFKSF